jgi:methylmalonyl-CoA/ethylmalonyl-CoA epimerase
MPLATDPALRGPGFSPSGSAHQDEGASAPEAILELDHLGLIVPDLAAGRAFLSTALNVTHWTPVTNDPLLGVAVQFGSTAQFGATPAHSLTYELISPLGDTTPIANALRTGKHILNHLAYLTPNLEASAGHLRAAGCYPVGSPQPALAYDGRRIQFFMSPLRFVIELIEKPGHRHNFTPE